MTTRTEKIVVIALASIVAACVVGELVSEAKPPTRVEAVASVAVTGFTDDQRLELAGQALNGLLANERTVVEVEAMFRWLMGEPNLWTQASVQYWYETYLAQLSVRHADRLLAALGSQDMLEAASEALELKDD